MEVFENYQDLSFLSPLVLLYNFIIYKVCIRFVDLVTIFFLALIKIEYGFKREQFHSVQEVHNLVFIHKSLQSTVPFTIAIKSIKVYHLLNFLTSLRWIQFLNWINFFLYIFSFSYSTLQARIKLSVGLKS